MPEYLKLRFDEKTRGFNAVSFAVMTIFSSGISMYAMGLLLQTLLGWDFNFSVLMSAVIVLLYIFLGGLTSAIYNEVLQFFLIVLRIPAAGFSWIERRGWLVRLTSAPGSRSDSTRIRLRRLEPVLEVHGQPLAQPDGSRMVRDGDGPGIRAVVRLLVH